MKLGILKIAAMAGFCLLLSCSNNNSTGPGGGGTATIPRVTATVPAGGSANVTTNSNIAITFNTAMDPTTAQAAISAVPIIAGGTFTWTGGNTTVVLDPSANLTGNTAYTVTVAATARSSGNRAMARDTSFTFNTVLDTGTTTPTVVSTDPADAAIGVPVNTYVTLTFNVPMDVAATEAALSASPAISGVVTWSNGDTRMTLIPPGDLRDTTRYTITLSTAAQSKLGINMAGAKSISFRTGTTSRPPTQIMGVIYRREDNSTISGANVVLFNANTNSPLQRVFSTSTGSYVFRVDSGNYYLSVTADGRIPTPPPWGRPNPFYVALDSTRTKNVFMWADTSTVPAGTLSGTITVSDSTISPSGILVVAIAADSTAFSTTTGPDGLYVFYNLPSGTYTLVTYRSGMIADTVVITATVVADSSRTVPNFQVLPDPIGRVLQGSLQFLAAPPPNSSKIVDISLVDIRTRMAIPGLSTKSDANQNYSLSGIPPGSYIAWASYENDGYVMDPDVVRRQGLPIVTFGSTDTLMNLGFALTNAINIISPTNPRKPLIPAFIDTLTPWFVWDHYSSAKQYIVEVVDQSGNRIWGGWDNTGHILGGRIAAQPPGPDSVQFNFDGTALEPLRQGGSYAWKVYADANDTAGVDHLISSSEDNMGLFKIGADTVWVDTNYVARPQPKVGAR